MDNSDIDEPITIVNFDSEWPKLYELEKQRVEQALHTLAPRIEHFGSTAVPGMSGKPIVDLLVGVENLASASMHVSELEALGYQNFGEIFISGRAYLRRRGPPHFNIAMTEINGQFWEAQLLLRDYLRAHPHEAAAYSESKKAVYGSGAHLFSSYSQAKGPFLAALKERAEAWNESVRAQT